MSDILNYLELNEHRIMARSNDMQTKLNGCVWLLDNGYTSSAIKEMICHY